MKLSKQTKLKMGHNSSVVNGKIEKIIKVVNGKIENNQGT